MAKISHTKIKQPSFREKKDKINLHQNFPIYSIDLVNAKVYMLLDPHVPMLKGWVGPSSFPRIMSLKVVFQICFGSIKMMGTRSGQLSYSIYVSKRDSCVQQYL